MPGGSELPRQQPSITLLGWAGLLALLLAAIFFDAYPYDILAYHGPFSAVATGLPRLSRFGMSAFMEHRYQGFPPLWRWLMAPGLGLGLPRLMLLPNLLALLILIGSCRRCLRLPWPPSLAAALLFPIALFGLRTPYQDFFVGALATAAVLLMIEALRLWAESGRGAGSAWLALPLLTAVTLTKYQGLFLAVLSLGLALPAAVLIGRRHRSLDAWRNGPFPVLLLALLLCSLHPLHNLLSHQNPFFPIAAGPFPGPEYKSSTEVPAYTAALAPFHTFLNHWLSASELDWIARGVVPSYNLDQARAQTQYGGLIDPQASIGFVRSGGSFGPAYLAALTGYLKACVEALRQWRLRAQVSPQAWALLGVAPFLVLGAGFPQSHELRYYLPLLLLPALTALGWGWTRWGQRWIEVLLLALVAVSLLLNFTQPLYSTAKGLRNGQGLDYAIRYPSRDLPSAAACLRKGVLLSDHPDTLTLPTGMAFACRLQMPALIRVVETEAPPPAAAQRVRLR